MALTPSHIPEGALQAAREAAIEAGRIALGYFRHGGKTRAGISYKEGGSPVTEADLAVDAFLKARLMGLAPGFGWLSEETADDPSRLGRRHVWVVDPIDGTRSFARGDTDWTVALGIVEDGVAVAGFVYAPVAEVMYEALPGGPALKNGVEIRASGLDLVENARIAGPGPMLDAMQAAGTPFRRMPRIHSLAYRLVHVADSSIDGALAGGRAHDWDLAAAHAIVSAAGAEIVTATGATPRYNRPSTMHEALVVASSGLAAELAGMIANGALSQAAGHKDAIAGL
ncbi:3'(2'),5'-bisphosphate nucleotidase CysQ [Alsobacter sp. SYSU BS001988]